MVSKSMLSSLLQKQFTYAPESQPFYTFRNGTWASLTHPAAVEPMQSPPSTEPLKSLHLINWNIDFMALHPYARMASALEHLEQLVSGIPSSSAVVILLQEMVEDMGYGPECSKDLSQIAGATWIQQRFNITDINSSQWESRYGPVTMIDRRLNIVDVSRLHFVSEYQRDAILVDVRLASDQSKILRLCNVHLDSSYGSMRPIQWKAAAKFLQNTDAAIGASILAGDCNANQPRDRTEPQQNGFTDAFLELGGVEGSEEGSTWGFQSLGWERWGRKRLDKQVFWGNMRVKGLQRIGVGVEVADQSARRELERRGKLLFVTDHYGLMGEYEIEDGLSVIV